MKAFLLFHLLSLTLILMHRECESGLTDHYQNCSQPITPSCGTGPNITFPFYLNNLQDSFCGYSGFNVSCDSQRRPVLKIQDDDFLLREINYQSFAVRLVYASLIDAFLTNSCLPSVHPLPSSEKFISPVTQSNLTLLYRCNSTAINGALRYPNRCPVNSSDHQPNDYVVLRGASLSRTDFDDCERPVTIPAVYENGSTEYVQTIFERGFWLKWTVPYNCSKCEQSGGKCGFDQDENQFVCYCPDHTVHIVGCRPGNSSTPGKTNDRGLEIGIGVGGGALIGIFMSAVIWYYHNRRKNNGAKRIFGSPSFKAVGNETKDHPAVPLFSYSELERATGHFSEEKELGDGAFGKVYYGKLNDGREVAVKRMYERSYQSIEQFMNEIEILAMIRHKHLVSLYGCTSRRSKELLLVYEYVPNGTVLDHLRGKREKLTWRVRMEIAVETASALAYLHASDIIHRDVKTNNILLDNNFTVKVADFGLSRLFPVDKTHISTAPQGTPGYVDPEYHLCYQLTEKSDVYSFGVFLIELVSSLPAVDITRNRSEINLGYFAVNRINKRSYDELIDESLGYKTDMEVRRMAVAVADLAYRCLQQEKDDRPSMVDVMDHLLRIQNNNETLPLPQSPLPPSPLRSTDGPLLDKALGPSL